LANNTITSQQIANGAISSSQVAPTSLGVDKLSATGAASSSTVLYGDNVWRPIVAPISIPTGMILIWTTLIAPSGFLFCNGLPVSRTTYYSLFSVIGTVFGAGDGSTTFNLPDFSGRTPFGLSGSPTFPNIGATGGSTSQTLSIDQLPAHSHNVLAFGQQAAAGTGFTGSGLESNSNLGSYQDLTSNTGSGNSFSILNPFVTVLFVIKT